MILGGLVNATSSVCHHCPLLLLNAPRRMCCARMLDETLRQFDPPLALDPRRQE